MSAKPLRRGGEEDGLQGSTTCQQISILLSKNWLQAKRGLGLTLAQILAPILVTLLLVGNQAWANQILNVQEPFPAANAINPLQRCIQGGVPQACTTVLFAPNVTEARTLMKRVADNAGLDFDRDFKPLPGGRSPVRPLFPFGQPAHSSATHCGIGNCLTHPFVNGTSCLPCDLIMDNYTMNALLAAEPNTTQNAVLFLGPYFGLSAPTDSYILYYNSTFGMYPFFENDHSLELKAALDQAQVELRAERAAATLQAAAAVAVDGSTAEPANGMGGADELPAQALAASMSGALPMPGPSQRAHLDLQLWWRRFPVPSSRIATLDVVSGSGAVWFYVPPMVVFFVLLTEIVGEKENRLRLGMRTMGLRNLAYWAAWAAWGAGLMLTAALLQILSGMAAQFIFFLHANFFVLLLLFGTFSVSMAAFAFALSTLLSTQRAAQTVGYSTIIFGFVFQNIISTAYGVLVDLMYASDVPGWVHLIRYVLQFYPPYSFAKCFYDISTKAGQTVDVRAGTLIDGPGFPFKQLFQPEPVTIPGFDIHNPAPIESIGIMFGLTLLYFGLAIYLDAVLPGAQGSPQHPLFCVGVGRRGCGLGGRCDRMAALRERRQSLLEARQLSLNGPGAPTDATFEEPTPLPAGAPAAPPLLGAGHGVAAAGVPRLTGAAATAAAQQGGEQPFCGPETASEMQPPATSVADAAQREPGVAWAAAASLRGMLVDPQSGEVVPDVEPKDGRTAVRLVGLRKEYHRCSLCLPLEIGWHWLVVLLDLPFGLACGCRPCGTPADPCARPKPASVDEHGRQDFAGALGGTEQSGGQQGVLAVAGLSLTMPANCLTAVLGHNGAGKTTTMQVLTGLHPPSAGYASVFGHDVESDVAAVHRRLGVCPQHDTLWAQLTAAEHLRLFARLKGVPGGDEGIEAEVATRLRQVGLQDVADVPAGTFSGGMRRRLSVAIACIGDVRLVLLDEPTTGMDPVNRASVWRLIQDMKRADRALVLIGHSMEEVEALADRVAVMAHGRLWAYGSPLELKDRWGGGYKLQVVTQVERTGEALARLRAVAPAAVTAARDAGSATLSFAGQAVPELVVAIRWLEALDDLRLRLREVVAEGCADPAQVEAAMGDETVLARAAADLRLGQRLGQRMRQLGQRPSGSAGATEEPGLADLEALHAVMAVTEWGVSLATLEDVFLAVNRFADSVIEQFAGRVRRAEGMEDLQRDDDDAGLHGDDHAGSAANGHSYVALDQ